MQKRRPQIRKKVADDSDESERENGAQSHESAIAALKAKRQPGSKGKRPVSAITATFGEEDEDVSMAPAPAPAPAPVAVTEPPKAPAAVPAPAKREEARAPANAFGFAKRRDPAAEFENSTGVAPMPDFIPLDMNSHSRGPVRAKGKSKLEAMVYASSEEDEDGAAEEPTPVVTDTRDGQMSASHFDSLRAVREQSLAAAPSKHSGHDAATRAGVPAAPVTLASLLSNYSGMLDAAKESFEQDSRELVRVNHSVAAGASALAALDADLAKASQQFEFFQANRHWVRSLCGFLSAKVHDIAELESRLDAYDENASINTYSRIAADLLDEIHEAETRGDYKVLVAGACSCACVDVDVRAPRLPHRSFWTHLQVWRQRCRQNLGRRVAMACGK